MDYICIICSQSSQVESLLFWMSAWFDECGLKIRDGNSPSMKTKSRKNQKKDQVKRKEKKLDEIKRERERKSNNKKYEKSS